MPCASLDAPRPGQAIEQGRGALFDKRIVSPNHKEYFELHKLLSEEMRHTATVVWQFSIAIVTLQGGAVGLAGQRGFDTTIGRVVLATGFLLSVCFSLMLLRQAQERAKFRDRIHAVEVELSKEFPTFFTRIGSWPGWFTSIVLAMILLVESATGLLLFVLYLLR
jgi:hypothetical protein